MPSIILAQAMQKERKRNHPKEYKRLSEYQWNECGCGGCGNIHIHIHIQAHSHIRANISTQHVKCFHNLFVFLLLLLLVFFFSVIALPFAAKSHTRTSNISYVPQLWVFMRLIASTFCFGMNIPSKQDKQHMGCLYTQSNEL